MAPPVAAVVLPHTHPQMLCSVPGPRGRGSQAALPCVRLHQPLTCKAGKAAVSLCLLEHTPPSGIPSLLFRGRRGRWEDCGVLSHGGNPTRKVLLGGDSFPGAGQRPRPQQGVTPTPTRDGSSAGVREGRAGAGEGSRERQPRRDPPMHRSAWHPDTDTAPTVPHVQVGRTEPPAGAHRRAQQRRAHVVSSSLVPV